MGHILKTIIRLIIGACVVLALGGAGLWYLVFGGLSAVQDAAPAPDVHVAKDGIVDVGIVEVGDKKALLIDTGADPEGKALLHELAQRGLAASDVVAIFLTHGHRDHTAGCHLFPKAEIYALEQDVALVEGHAESHGPLTQFMGPTPQGIHVTHPLHDGDVIEIGSKSIRAFHVPGHTPGSAAYAVASCLFVGDSANVTSWGDLQGAPWPFSDDIELNHRSLRALADKLRSERGSIIAIVPAHSGVGAFDALSRYTP